MLYVALPPALARPQADASAAARIRGRGRASRRDLDRLITAHIDGRFDLVPAATKRGLLKNACKVDAGTTSAIRAVGAENACKVNLEMKS